MLWDVGNNMKKSFLNATSPFITEMVQVSTASRAEHDIRNASLRLW